MIELYENFYRALFDFQDVVGRRLDVGDIATLSETKLQIAKALDRHFGVINKDCEHVEDRKQAIAVNRARKAITMWRRGEVEGFTFSELFMWKPKDDSIEAILEAVRFRQDHDRARVMYAWLVDDVDLESAEAADYANAPPT